MTDVLPYKKPFFSFPQMPKGFSVRVFKGPTVTSSLPYGLGGGVGATAQFDVGYRPTTMNPSTDSWPSHPNLPRTSSSSSSIDPRLFALPMATTTITSHIRTYDARLAPPYSIYPNPTNDTYIYERSDTYSFSEADDSPALSSLFSPALSIDSSTTIKDSEPSALPERNIPSRIGPLQSTTSSISIQREPSASASNALSIVRVASSSRPGMTTSSGNPQMDGSLSLIPSAIGRSKTPVQGPLTRAPSRGPSSVQYPPRPTSASNSYFPNHSFQMPNMGRSRSQPRPSQYQHHPTWNDYIEETILDQSSELARMNASLNARASAAAQYQYSRAENVNANINAEANPDQSFPAVPLEDDEHEYDTHDHTDYQSIPQVPLPPDDGAAIEITRYTPEIIMSSSPESYYATTTAGAEPSHLPGTSPSNSSRRSASTSPTPVLPLPTRPGSQPRRNSSSSNGKEGSPQRDRMGGSNRGASGGPFVPYQVAASSLSQQHEQDPSSMIPPGGIPMTYMDQFELGDDVRGDGFRGERGTRYFVDQPSSQPFFTGGDYARGNENEVSGRWGEGGGGGSVSSNGSRASPPLVGPLQSHLTSSSSSSSSSASASSRFSMGMGISGSVSREQERPLPIPPPSNQPALPFPPPPPAVNMGMNFPTRSSSVSPPLPITSDDLGRGRTRKDSLAVEAARAVRKRRPSVSPPTITTNGIITSGAGPLSARARSPINDSASRVWGSMSRNAGGGGVTPVTVRQQSPLSLQPPPPMPSSPTSSNNMNSALVNTATTRRPVSGPRRMNSDPATTTVNDAISAPPIPPVPQRRHTDNELALSSGVAPACIARCRVRWSEKLVCPSPIAPDQRKKGWFNRRGDQLWTNEGAYKPPPSGQEFPVELDTYPEYGQGWMNEEGTRIDMEHRLVPKAPLRSALKRPTTPA
ncbi:hypothetical protein ONZ45_g9656 [Pleurotus djamor]|nr:hypothetical protein ONZ45_g9656 [Pleurotus djamor]